MKTFIKVYGVNLLFIVLNLIMNWLYEWNFKDFPVWLHIVYVLTIQSFANISLFFSLAALEFEA